MMGTHAFPPRAAPQPRAIAAGFEKFPSTAGMAQTSLAGTQLQRAVNEKIKSDKRAILVLNTSVE